MAKKRPTLDAFLSSRTPDSEEVEDSDVVSARKAPQRSKSTGKVRDQPIAKKEAPSAPEKPGKPEIVRHMLYLPLPVYDQLQGLIFEEQRGKAKRRKTHDYLLDAIDLLFRKKGLKSIAELTEKDF